MAKNSMRQEAQGKARPERKARDNKAMKRKAAKMAARKKIVPRGTARRLRREAAQKDAEIE